MKTFISVFWFMLLALKPAFAEVFLNAEIFHLEEKKKNSEIKSTDVLRLAELYFLSSRCSEIKGLFVYQEKMQALNVDEKQVYGALVCACGGVCSAQLSKNEKGVLLLRLKQLSQELSKVVAGSKKWKSADIQLLWKKLEDHPEAQYLVYKNLKSAPLKERNQNALFLSQLESELDSYEVK